MPQYWSAKRYSFTPPFTMGDWKAIRLGGEGGRLELYDLKRDIGEKHDLSKRHPEIIARIKKIMKESHDVPRI